MFLGYFRAVIALLLLYWKNAALTSRPIFIHSSVKIFRAQSVDLSSKQQQNLVTPDCIQARSIILTFAFSRRLAPSSMSFSISMHICDRVCWQVYLVTVLAFKLCLTFWAHLWVDTDMYGLCTSRNWRLYVHDLWLLSKSTDFSFLITVRFPCTLPASKALFHIAYGFIKLYS